MQYLVFDKNITQRWRRVKNFVESTHQIDFWSEVKKHTRSLLKDLIEISMLDELTQYLGRLKHQRITNPMDYRNGYYCRNLDTELGPLNDLSVPRCRSGLFKTKVFDSYQRRQKAVNQAICNVFLAGVSTRDVSSSIKPLLETTFSASCVSRITKSLDAKVKEYHQRHLLDEYQYLFLDGITLSVKGAVKARKKLVLVAYGLTIFPEF